VSALLTTKTILHLAEIEPQFFDRPVGSVFIHCTDRAIQAPNHDELNKLIYKAKNMFTIFTGGIPHARVPFF
jgi:hypothetical protein